jgi:predicted SnoaL-like aldol condensation-catalyzing enzyme
MRAIKFFGAALLLAAMPTAAFADTAKHERNKALVVEFYKKSINDKNFEEASKYLGDTYIQHNPTAKDGPEGLRAFLAFLREKFPDSKSEIKRVFADGDYVILHVHSVRTPGTLGRAIIDIFRLDQNGKVVEHWDAVQDIPENPQNNNTMF